MGKTRLWLIIVISGVIALSIGLLVLSGWIFRIGALTSVFPQYIPMAPVTAFISAVFGLILISGTYNSKNYLFRNFTIMVIVLFSLYGLLKFIEYFAKTELTLDRYFFPVRNYLGQFPIRRASPATGLLFFFCGFAILLKILERKHPGPLNIISILGGIVTFSGFTGWIGYLFGTPFFYGGDIIPLALPTTIVFLALGLGIIAMGGNDSLLLKPISGNRASARILRAILPVIVIAMLADDIVDVILSHLFSINHVLISAVTALILIPFTIWLVYKVSQIIFQRADKAEEDRRKAESALKESERWYRLLVENQGEGVTLVNPEECFVFANPAAERIFAVPSGTLKGRNIIDFVHPNHMTKLLMETEKRSKAEPSTYELEIINAEQQTRTLLVTATPQLNEQGIFTGTFGVFRDITDRKRVEEKLEQFAKELEESNITKDKFFSIIAHDLINPFNSILGLTDNLQTEFQSMDQKEIEQHLSMISKSSEVAFELLENLLLWANSQTGRIQFNPTLINLKDTINEMITLLQIQASWKNINIVLKAKDDISVLVDIQMFQIVIRNLLSNAIKFTPLNGIITIEVKQSENYHQISIIDQGTGIAPDDIPKLFRIDTKYTSRGTANEKGSGLGLLLCKEFVEIHGGKIWVDSIVNEGSIFNFTIPIVTSN